MLKDIFKNMKDIEYVKAHWQYKLIWGIIFYGKEVIKWIAIVIFFCWLFAEITSGFNIIW